MLTLEEVKAKYVKDERNPNFKKGTMSTLIADSYGIEQHAAKQIRKIIDESSVDYPTIDLSFLKTRRPDGYPQFAMYSLTSPNCKVGITYSHSTFKVTTANVSPGCFAKYVKDITDKFDKESRSFSLKKIFSLSPYVERTWIETTFNGLIPQEVRAEIKNATRTFNSNIFIVEEAKEWAYKKELKILPAITKVDPLVIGIKGDKGYLISSFDLTPIENLVADLHKES